MKELLYKMGRKLEELLLPRGPLEEKTRSFIIESFKNFDNAVEVPFFSPCPTHPSSVPLVTIIFFNFEFKKCEEKYRYKLMQK